MQSSSDTTASTSPISPFSSFSVPSEPTSDELPDLGAFTTVLRAWTHLQPPLRTFSHQPQFTTTSTPSSMEPESDDVHEQPSLPGSTVWSHHPIALYLDSISGTPDTDGRSPSPGSGSNTEGDTPTHTEPVGYELSDLEDLDLSPQPSLGLLDGALSFIAAERARWNAQREAGTANEEAWRHVVEPRRKRRRKRTARTPKTDDSLRDDPIEEGDSIIAEDADDSSSSFDNTTTTTTNTTAHKSVPATPARSRKERRRQQALASTSGGANRVLIHSKSTPQLRVLPSILEPHPHYPRLVQLRALAKKLGKVFPADKPALDTLIPPDLEFHQRLKADDFFVDPRGPPPGDKDTLIHVFIDHSNILIGLLTYLKRYPRTQTFSTTATITASSNTHVATPAPTITAFSFPPKPHARSKHLSHAALALILERGRPITRRVLVTSSPLYQPMDTAERLGYEVRVYARVPDLGDGQDRVRPGGHSRKGGGRKGRRGHVRRVSGSAGSTSTESEQMVATGFPQAFVRSLGAAGGTAAMNIISASPPSHAPISSSLPMNGGISPPVHTATPPKIKYREQGVDELLQLKLHQALAALDGPPPLGATIVLATGDGNVGQFNEDGFLGPVRTALKKGWRVELYAWEEGLSRSWMREFGDYTKPLEGETTGRFQIVGMEQFAGELLEIY
ncbi:hypothetical protein FB45DRAFT_980637 [Roridomyces roridus]|uniref:NYN domain-containing protein n=1 Tax=Roridomyces roridus TaxID=1738132 RepID=A0AAD7BH99_9AGAR|nr:hypothetical protein FB45DRAFT_980637 [Roridomyces roridus]